MTENKRKYFIDYCKLFFYHNDNNDITVDYIYGLQRLFSEKYNTIKLIETCEYMDFDIGFRIRG